MRVETLPWSSSKMKPVRQQQFKVNQDQLLMMRRIQSQPSSIRFHRTGRRLNSTVWPILSTKLKIKSLILMTHPLSAHVAKCLIHQKKIFMILQLPILISVILVQVSHCSSSWCSTWSSTCLVWLLSTSCLYASESRRLRNPWNLMATLLRAKWQCSHTVPSLWELITMKRN